jgi:hypothetical protein
MEESGSMEKLTSGWYNRSRHRGLDFLTPAVLG